DAERERAVPGKILELRGAHEHRRGEAVDGVEADVLDPGRVLGADGLALDGIAGDDLAAAGRQRGDEVALEVDALGKTVELAGGEASAIFLRALLRLGRDVV